MRKLFLLVVMTCVCAGLASAQQGKIDSQWTCTKATSTDTSQAASKTPPTHMKVTFTCTATKGEIAGVKEKDGKGTETDDIKGDKVSGKGTFVESLENGDTLNIKYTVQATMKDGMVDTGSNKWQIASGTGKFKGIKGSGGCTGKGNADGSSAYDCTGNYSMAKK